MINRPSLPANIDFPDRDYVYKSAATQFLHDAVLASIPYNGRKFLPHRESNLRRVPQYKFKAWSLIPRGHAARTGKTIYFFNDQYIWLLRDPSLIKHDIYPAEVDSINILLNVTQEEKSRDFNKLNGQLQLTNSMVYET